MVLWMVVQTCAIKEVRCPQGRVGMPLMNCRPLQQLIWVGRWRGERATPPMQPRASRLEEAPGGARRHQEAPGGATRIQQAPHSVDPSRRKAAQARRRARFASVPRDRHAAPRRTGPRFRNDFRSQRSRKSARSRSAAPRRARGLDRSSLGHEERRASLADRPERPRLREHGLQRSHSGGHGSRRRSPARRLHGSAVSLRIKLRGLVAPRRSPNCRRRRAPSRRHVRAARDGASSSAARRRPRRRARASDARL